MAIQKTSKNMKTQGKKLTLKKAQEKFLELKAMFLFYDGRRWKTQSQDPQNTGWLFIFSEQYLHSQEMRGDDNVARTYWGLALCQVLAVLYIPAASFNHHGNPMK